MAKGTPGLKFSKESCDGVSNPNQQSQESAEDSPVASQQSQASAASSSAFSSPSSVKQDKKFNAEVKFGKDDEKNTYVTVLNQIDSGTTASKSHDTKIDFTGKGNNTSYTTTLNNGGKQ